LGKNLDIYSNVKTKESGKVRPSRKLEHLRYSLLLHDGPVDNGFADFTLIHNCLPDISWDDLNLSCSIAGIPMKHPIIVNAITGGGMDVLDVNARLAEFSRITGTVMALGSQYSAFENPEVQDSYKIVNKLNPNGDIIANLGAHATVEQAKKAVEMVGAKALQIHLNAAQELFMTEGDRQFSGYLKNIDTICSRLHVPVIVKEVGFGIAKEQALKLIAVGVKAIDVGGAGGTNFVAIESARSGINVSQDALAWGIPTAVSAVEVSSVLSPHVDLIVSGGIRTPLEVIKSLAIGGQAVGIAGPIIRLICENSMDVAVNWFNNFLNELKQYMLLLGAKNLKNLIATPMIITGRSREWLTARKIDINKYSNP
jgi:isopentenyl-diphosphate delta-isomerase